MRSGVNVALILLFVSAIVSAQLIPTTTLTAETSSNTSAAMSFAGQPNGNVAAGNVSKVDHRTLLYPGATTQIYTNIMYWFGQSNHVNVGYNSTDPVQIHNQVDDHLSRGITGTIVDWYGTGHPFDNNATLLLKADAESRSGYPFKFAIMEDKGALLVCANTPGCDLNQQLISDLTYVYNTYMNSPAYMKFDGRPAVFFFGLERWTINWDQVKAAVPGNPLFIFQNQGGYTHPATDGAFSWVQINTTDANDWKKSYLDNFYATALNYPAQHTFAATWKGFNDTIAAWSLNRITNQNCAQTWLSTFKEIGKYYSSSNQLESLQIVTWNDYEEGTEIESGIDNCVAIAGSVSGDTVSWSISGGSEDTIDHYTIFASIDGENLMSLVNVAAGIHSVDLSGYGLGLGSYKLYIKAVGKPSITNKMSAAISYTVGNQAPVVMLSATPTSGIAPVSVAASTAGSYDPDGTIAWTKIDFGDGAVVNGTTASHTYVTPGNYTITAIACDNLNRTSTSTYLITAVGNQSPVAMITASPASGVAPVTVTASTGSSSDPDGTIVASKINFGDGTVVNAVTASHVYNVAGSYSITGSVTDNMGTVSSAYATVTVSAAPETPSGVLISAPTNYATVPSPVRFVASATPNPGTAITAMRIYVDSMSVYTVSANTIDITLALTTGQRNVIVQAWDNTGTVYKSSIYVNVCVPNKPPVVSLGVSPTNTTTGSAVNASLAGSTDTDGYVAKCKYDFGDGVVMTVASPATSAAHAYTTPGSYTVTGTVFDNLGASASRSVLVTVAPVSISGVYVSSPSDGATLGSPVHFVASASSSKPITAMRIYVDSVSAYTVNANKLDTYLKIAAGQHSVIVQAWDSSGAVFKSKMNITAK